MAESAEPTAYTPSSHSLQEPAASSPLWVEYSGFPEWVNGKAGKNAWLVMKKVMELDCAQNAQPATVEVTPAEIAAWCGLDSATVMKCLEGLRKKKCLALFLPDHPEEPALIEVRTPLRTPKSAAEVRRIFPFNRMDSGVRFRYATKEDGDTAAARSYVAACEQKGLQRVIDLYFNSVGFKMNTFVLDQLRLICQRFEADAVEKTFDRARKNDIRSLGWIVKELYQVSKKNE